MTVWADTMAETMVQPAPLQTVIDWSMTVSVDNKWGNVHHYKTVIDQSMTVWLWTSSLWPCVIDFGQ